MLQLVPHLASFSEKKLAWKHWNKRTAVIFMVVMPGAAIQVSAAPLREHWMKTKCFVHQIESWWSSIGWVSKVNVNLAPMLSHIIQTLTGKFSRQGCQNYFLCVQRNIFRKSNGWKKMFKIFRTFCKIIVNKLVKTWFSVSGGAFWEEAYYSGDELHKFFHTLSNKLSDFEQKVLDRVVKTTLFVHKRTFSEKQKIGSKIS